MSKTTYRVVYERDRESGWWLARVPAVRGCHTQGRTVEEARRRIREALGLFVDDAAEAELRDAVSLPATERQAIRAYLHARGRVVIEEDRAAKTAKQAVERLLNGALKLSVRDAAAVLGVSHQRVHQIAKSHRNR